MNHAVAISFGIMDALLVVAMLYDYRTLKRVHRAYLWSAVDLVLVQIAVAWAFQSAEWLSIARLLIQS